MARVAEWVENAETVGAMRRLTGLKGEVRVPSCPHAPLYSSSTHTALPWSMLLLVDACCWIRCVAAAHMAAQLNRIEHLLVETLRTVQQKKTTGISSAAANSKDLRKALRAIGLTEDRVNTIDDVRSASDFHVDGGRYGGAGHPACSQPGR